MPDDDLSNLPVALDVLDADDRSREILARTLAFVGTNVGTTWGPTGEPRRAQPHLRPAQ